MTFGLSAGAIAMIGAGGAVAGGLIAANGAKDAANSQVSAANNATASQQQMFNTQIGLEAPYRTAGVDSLNKLSYLLGTSPTGYSASGTTGTGVASPGSGSASDGYGSLGHNFDLSDFQLDPGVQFQMQQGQQALQNSQASKDGVLSGAAEKGLMTFNQGLAGTGYQSAYDRYMANKNFTLSSLMGLTNLGQAAASNTASGGSSYSNGIAGTITGAGNAAAAGSVGSANAISGGLSGASNSLMLSNLLNNGSGSVGTPPPPNPFYTAAG